MQDLRLAVGEKEGFRRKLDGGRSEWAGHLERAEGEWLTKNEEARRVERRRRRGTLRLEDCVNIYLGGHWTTI